ncbi:MAG TPA: cation-transporting P-type ATPase [Methylococcus sp.]|nr:cation-transporting P-type ATPase [Methylococcus sp.]
MKIHQLSVEESFASLKTGPGGLSEAEARRRLAEYGRNVVEELKREPLAARFVREFTHFFAATLWIAAGLAFFAETQDPSQGMATLGWAIVGVILINGLFSFWQQYRAERALAALLELLPSSVKVVREGQIRLILASELVPGDVILLQEGDSVPADCRLIEAFSLRVNNATVTGESLPQGRDPQPSSEELLLHSRNVLLAGTSLVSGEGKAVVFATGMHTEFGKIAHLTQIAREEVSPLQREIVRLSRLIALLAFTLGVGFFFVGQSIGMSFWENFIFAIGIIVANVPEGLLPTVTLSLAMATQRMARRKALICHLPAVETLGSAMVICTDKTGTLTQNRMEAQVVHLHGETLRTGELFRDSDRTRQSRHLLEVASLCHDLHETRVRGKSTWLGDPMEVSLVRLGRTGLGEVLAYPKINEIPFDTDRKRLSTIHHTPSGTVLYCKGALETVLPLCDRFESGGKTVPLTEEERRNWFHAQESLAMQGLRVLAFAWRRLDGEHQGPGLEQNLILCGLVGLADPPRPEVPEAIRKCREAGIRVIMVTGDHPHTAVAIGRSIGQIQTEHPAVITGEQLHRLSETQLRLALDEPEILFARVGADQKMRIVEALKRKGHVVAVTGDGVNDAPALKRADIGIAMGLSGTDVAREAADMILLDDNFASIVAAIEEGRAVYQNIRRFLRYVLTSNIPEIIPYLAFVLFKIPLPLTIIQILAVDLGTDMVPALGLGSEKPAPGVMRQPPRSRQERLIDANLIGHAYLFLGIMEAVAAMAAYFFVLERGGWVWGTPLMRGDTLYLQATTACLSAIIVMQVANVFLCKTHPDSVFHSVLFDNPVILWGIAIEIALILIIDYSSWGQLLFGTYPISLEVWLFMLPFAPAMVALEETRKWWVRRSTRLPGIDEEAGISVKEKAGMSSRKK